MVDACGGVISRAGVIFLLIFSTTYARNDVLSRGLTEILLAIGGAFAYNVVEIRRPVRTEQPTPAWGQVEKKEGTVP